MTAMPEVLREDTLNIPDSRGLNLYTCDPALERLLEVYLPPALLAEWRPLLERLGARAGGELDVLALAADKNPPVLVPRTRRGEDLQSIRKHPDYVALERVAYAELGLASMSHRPDGPPPLVKYALTHLFVQAEFGLCCPVSMTDSLTRTLRRFGAPELVERYLPSLASRDFDELFQGAMFMTEQAAGSDVARTRTVAREQGGEWKLYGDKWFCSNPDADLAMVLARPEGAPEGMKGVTLFLLPKVREDGTRNAYRIVRLKDKLGSRSMASGEVRLEGASAYLIGEIGRGFQQMADMVNMSRLSNGVRAAGLMRRALSEALFVARHRRAFGKHLIDMPLMQKQLLKMMLPTEQARSMFMQIATLLPRADGGEVEAQKCVRILTPLIKFRACRDARRVTGDAMEVRGGVGYIEEWSDPRLVRDAHLGSIWEGTSNIVALDVARAVSREQALEPLRRHLRRLLDDSDLPGDARDLFDELLVRVVATMADVAERRQDEQVRQAGSALYHLCTAIFMAWEASGLKIIDLSRVLGGPYCSQALADHGAEVIKLEPLGGDETRGWGPPFEGDTASYFKGVNRNKKGIAVDLATAEGIELLLRLLEDADVLLENFKPGTLARWGIGYEEVLRQRFPRLVHCAVSGFGADGPLGGLPGYDAAIQAMAGLMSVNGEAGGEALRIGLPIVDMVTGLNAMAGILLALHERQVSGRGQSVDIALYDCGISLLHPHLPNYFASGRTPRRSGNAHPNIAPYDSYRTGTEPIFLAVGNDRQFARLCEYLGADELPGDPRFADNGKRSVNREALKRALEDYLAAHDGRELAERLIRLGVPCGAIATVDRVVEHPHTRHRGMVVELEGYCGIASPVKLSRTPASYRAAPPVLGGDTREVLAELGLSAEAIDALVRRGIVRA